MKSSPRRLAVLGVLGAMALSSCAGTAEKLLNSSNSTRGLTVKQNEVYGPDERNRLDVYAPPSAQHAPVVLFIHGGSWTGGDKSIYSFVGESMARAGYVTGVMNYRLAPQNRYPSYVQDAASALKWLREHAKEFGGEPDNLFVMGHSAGGFNAAEMVDNARWLKEVDVPVSSIRGVIGIAGPYSYDYRTLSSRNAFPEGSSPDDVMPDRHIRPDAPPHLLLVAANDTTVYPQNALNMEAALKKAGIPVQRTVLPRLNHVTIVGSLARNLTFLGRTRADVLEFIEARKLR